MTLVQPSTIEEPFDPEGYTAAIKMIGWDGRLVSPWQMHPGRVAVAGHGIDAGAGQLQ